jgi:hypothetical protein
MFADFAMLSADAVVALDFELLSVAPACRRDVCQVVAYPQKLAAHALAVDDPWDEPCVEDVDAGVCWLDLLPPPHPAAIAATSAKTETIWAVRAITVDTAGMSVPSILPRRAAALIRKG